MKIFGLVILFFAMNCHAQLNAEKIQTHFQESLKKSGIKSDDLGIYMTVGEGDSKKTIIDHNGKKVFIPASITKVATASAVLEAFPPGYKFKTQILTTSEKKDGVLRGSLYLKGGGDPSFVSENLWYLVNAFTRSGIKKIEGDIIVDDSLFDKVRFDETRQKNRVDRAYDAPIGAMSFNWNSANIFVRPANKIGEKADVTIDPENDYIRLLNKASTAKGFANNLIAERREDKKFPGDLIQVSGSIGVGANEVAVFKNITQPDLWSGYNLKSFLAQRNITVTGTVKNGVTPAGAKLVAESESKPVELVLADMNKFSNNYVAEMLTKNIGTLKKSSGVSLADGILVLRDHLKKIGVPEEQMDLSSPSGLSRENKMSSFAMWKVLAHLRQDSRVQPEFLTSLPIAGVDGTLKKRMKNTAAERLVRAKTGFLTGVVSLAGYAGLEDGNVVTFSFIYNGSANEAQVRAFFDNLLTTVVN